MPESLYVWTAYEFWWSVHLLTDRVERELEHQLPEGKVQDMIIMCLLDNAECQGIA